MPWNQKFLVASGGGKYDFGRLLNFLSFSLCLILPCRIKNVYRPCACFFSLFSMVPVPIPVSSSLQKGRGDESRERSSVQIKCYTLRPDRNAHLFVLSESLREKRFLILVSLPAESTEINCSLLVFFTRNTYGCLCSLKIFSLQVESENADLKLQVVLVTKERDSVIQTNQGLQTKLENLEQVLKVSRIHMAGRTVQTPTFECL